MLYLIGTDGDANGTLAAKRGQQAFYRRATTITEVLAIARQRENQSDISHACATAYVANICITRGISQSNVVN